MIVYAPAALWLGCALCWAGALALWVATLMTIRRGTDQVTELTRRIDTLAAQSISRASVLPPTVGVRPGPVIVRGVAVERLPGAPPAGRTAVPDGWVQR